MIHILNGMFQLTTVRLDLEYTARILTIFLTEQKILICCSGTGRGAYASFMGETLSQLHHPCNKETFKIQSQNKLTRGII